MEWLTYKAMPALAYTTTTTNNDSLTSLLLCLSLQVDKTKKKPQKPSACNTTQYSTF